MTRKILLNPRHSPLVIVFGLILGGCGSSTSVPAAPKCSLASDCQNPLQCVQGYCVAACKESRDCPSGERCIATDQGNTCQPVEKATCQYTSQCTKPLVCAIDLQCRNQCQQDIDCATGQKCTSVTHLCADPTIDKNYNPTTNEFNGMDDGGVTLGGNQDGAVMVDADAAVDAPLVSKDAPNGSGNADSGTAVDTIRKDVSAATCSPGLAGYHPSNLPFPLVQPSGLADVTQSMDGIFDTDALTFTPTAASVDAGTFGATWKAVVVTLTDGREAAAVFFKSYSLATDITLAFTGSRPLILAADGAITVDGKVYATQSPTNKWYGGGAPGPASASRGGICPLDVGLGGGGPGGVSYADDIGAGGGGYCGRGGGGSIVNVADASASANGGLPYGNAEIVPLAGGSSGGSAELTVPEIHGGGAIELVSGTSVVIGTNAVVNLGGGGQTTSTSRGLGGGSGGAILLEAPSVSVRGILAVNGGSGSTSYDQGTAGLASVLPAPGGYSVAGNGSDGTHIDGQSAQSIDRYAAGGGGGAGRIRMNTGCGGTLNLNSAAVFSPSTVTTCVTNGTLN